MRKNEAFMLMRQLGATKAVVRFSGGGDEGGVDQIILSAEGIDPFEIETEGTRREPATEQGRIKVELAKILEAPIYAEYSTFAGEFHVDGEYTWDAVAGTVKVEKDESTEQWDHTSEEW